MTAVSQSKPAGRKDYLGVPKGLLPIDEQLRRLECRVKQLEAVCYGRGHCREEVAIIKQVVSAHFKITARQLSSRSQLRMICDARHVAVWLCDRLLRISSGNLREAFGRRDPHTVRWSLKNVEARLETEPKFRLAISQLETAAATALARSNVPKMARGGLTT